MCIWLFAHQRDWNKYTHVTCKINVVIDCVCNSNNNNTSSATINYRLMAMYRVVNATECSVQWAAEKSSWNVFAWNPCLFYAIQTLLGLMQCVSSPKKKKSLHLNGECVSVYTQIHTQGKFPCRCWNRYTYNNIMCACV